MKRIRLRVDHDPQLGELSWAEILRQVVRRPLDPSKGADIEELRRGIRLLDALDKEPEVLELEDADWDHLRDKVQAFSWGIVDRRVLNFVDDVLGATETPTLNGVLDGTAVAS